MYVIVACHSPTQAHKKSSTFKIFGRSNIQYILGRIE
jgi:hypothetical protein